MPDSLIIILRRRRTRIHRQLDRYERLVAVYQANLAGVEAAIHELEPELRLQGRFREPNPIFARGELPRLALAIMREAGEPLPIRVIAVRALARKGIALPDPQTRHRTRKALRMMFGKLDRRGVTVLIGAGAEARRGVR